MVSEDSLKASPNLLLRISPLSTVIHISTDPEDLSKALNGHVPTFLDDAGDLLKLSEVALLLRRQEPEPFEERDDILDDGVEVVDLIVPNAIVSLSERATSQVALEQSQDDPFPLRDIEAQRDLPRHPIVGPRSEHDVETPLAVGETGKVIADVRRNFSDVEGHSRLQGLSCGLPAPHGL